MVERAMFVIAVPDLLASASYYESVLGFTVHDIGDEGWRLFERGACRIMAGHCPDAMPPQTLGDHSYFAYLVVDDVEQDHATVTARGAKVTKPIRSEPWGMREFGIRTGDGHRIRFGQDLDA